MRYFVALCLALGMFGLGSKNTFGQVQPRGLATRPVSDSEGLSSLLSTGSLAPAGHRYALCIGIDGYGKDSGYPPLQCAVADAKSLGAVFAALGYHTTVMTDDGTGINGGNRRDPTLEPTAANIKRELTDLARKATNPYDELIISYAGHGDIIDKQAAIVPIDYSSKAHNLVTVASILGALNDPQCHAGDKLLLLDACHSGSVDKGFLPEFSHEKSLIVFSACSANQSSMEDVSEGHRHGRFTEVLIRGLVGTTFSETTTRPAGETEVSPWDGDAYVGQSEFLKVTDLSDYVGHTFKENKWSRDGTAAAGASGDNAFGQNPQMFSHQDVTAPMIVARRKVTVKPPPLTSEDLETITDILKKAVTAYASRDWVAMINHATTVLRIQDGNPDALALRALANLRATYIEKADDDARAALQSDPNQAMAQQVHGMCAAARNDKPGASSYLKAADRLINADPAKWPLLAKGEEAAYRTLAIGLVTADGQEAIDCLTKAAASPDLPPDIRGEVALILGQKYENSTVIPQKSKALEQSDDRNSTAKLAAGVLHEESRGVPQDYAEAMSWYRKAADFGDAEAIAHIGRLFQMGLGIPKDYAEALRQYNKAVDTSDDADQMNWIGFMHEHGQWFPKADFGLAMSCYLKAAEGKSAMAMNNIGSLYFYGRGVPPDYTKAMWWWQKGAALGSADAMCGVGYLYDFGLGTDKDSFQARSWYQRASDAGNAIAMFNFGRMYNDGRGVQQNYPQALAWYSKAAEAGNAGAGDQIDQIGMLYEHGNGVPQSYGQAMVCYRKAANAKNARSMYHMAILYENGRGTTKKDMDQARSWYRKAAELGDDDAKKWLAVQVGNRRN